MGVAQSPEGRHVFPRMTVRENLELGAYLRRDESAIQDDLERVFTLFPRLKERERQKGGTMSGGEQQMLAIGRALMAQPDAAAARRAVDGARADPGRAHLRDDRRDQPPGHDDPAGRAERQLRARGVHARLRARDRVASPSPTSRRRCARTPRSRRPTWERDRDRRSPSSEPPRSGSRSCGSARRSSPRCSRSMKGYGEKSGLVTGTVLSVLGAFVWAVVPPREISRWKLHGGLTGRARTVLIVVEVVLLIVVGYLVATTDASSGGPDRPDRGGRDDPRDRGGARLHDRHPARHGRQDDGRAAHRARRRRTSARSRRAAPARGPAAGTVAQLGELRRHRALPGGHDRAPSRRRAS